MTDSIQMVIKEMVDHCENNISGGCAWIDDWAERLIDLTSKPDAYMLKTGHGTKIVEEKPDCEIDYWKPLYRMEK